MYLLFGNKQYQNLLYVFFRMGYTNDDMEYYMELATPEEWDNYQKVIFEDDFWEGQEWFKLEAIVPLDRVCNYYRDNVLKPLKSY